MVQSQRFFSHPQTSSQQHNKNVQQQQQQQQQVVYDEKEPLLGSSPPSYGTDGADRYTDSSGSGGGSGGDLPVGIRTYRTRFWMLISFFFLSWIHDILWIIWGPISESMNAAFPGWGPSTVSLMENWGTIMYVVFFIPMAWAAQRYGLRASVVANFAIVTGGAALRCITSTTPAFTILSHVCGMAVGVASPIILSAPTLIATDWFPVEERTTALAIMVGGHQLGGVVTFLEPLVVRSPGPGVTPEDIKSDVMRLVYIVAGASCAMLLAIVIYFPSKPPVSPSISSSEERVRFLPAVKSLIRNKKFMLLLVCYGVFVGPTVMWLPIIDYSLLPLGFHQNSAMWIGIMGMLISSAASMVVGRLNDLLHGHTKALLVVLMLATTAFFFWFLLISYRVLPVTVWQVYVSTVGAVSCSYATLPLFIEIAIDLVYPAPEILVTAVMICADNLSGTIFLFLFSIPDPNKLWVTYVLTLCSAIPTVPMVLATFPETRTRIDFG